MGKIRVVPTWKGVVMLTVWIVSIQVLHHLTNIEESMQLQWHNLPILVIPAHLYEEVSKISNDGRDLYLSIM